MKHGIQSLFLKHQYDKKKSPKAQDGRKQTKKEETNHHHYIFMGKPFK